HWYRFTTTHCAIWTGTDWDTLRIYEAEENRLLDDRVHAIAVDGHRTLWFGTDEGVSKLLLPRESTTNICVDAEWGTGFPIDR
ncbi:hypothetical protein GWN15_21805, partial [candidate division KSB1 bacterium]|nr:hypothetical protein [candidate division KSB1 bacterium]NIW71484.1 hypothetical protein [candidate division KSB1 bacterium]